MVSDSAPVGALQPGPPELSRTGLSVGSEGLAFGGASLAALARAHGTPTYVYDAARVRAAVAELRAALSETGLRSQIFYAMKANRFAPLLALLRAEGDVGIDACSPREVEGALAAGFRPEELSFTGGMLSIHRAAAGPGPSRRNVRPGRSPPGVAWL